MKFDTQIHDIVLQKDIENQLVVIKGYISNICQVVNKVQNKTTRHS